MLLILLSSITIFSNYDIVSATYVKMGYPEWMIIPSALLKILATLAIVIRLNKWSKELGYIILFISAVAGLVGMLKHPENEFAISVGAILIISLVVSRINENTKSDTESEAIDADEMSNN